MLQEERIPSAIVFAGRCGARWIADKVRSYKIKAPSP